MSGEVLLSVMRSLAWAQQRTFLAALFPWLWVVAITCRLDLAHQGNAKFLAPSAALLVVALAAPWYVARAVMRRWYHQSQISSSTEQFSQLLSAPTQISRISRAIWVVAAAGFIGVASSEGQVDTGALIATLGSF